MIGGLRTAKMFGVRDRETDRSGLEPLPLLSPFMHERVGMASRVRVANQQRGDARGTSEDEARLIALVRARDVPAFEQLYKAYHGRLTRFLINMTHRPQIVGEVLNDTMMVVWNRIDSYNGTSRLATWIFGIAYRQGMNALRRLDEPVEQDEDCPAEETGASPEAEAGAVQARGKLLAAVGALSPAHRAVVNLAYFHGMGYREIAEIVDCPEDTVKTRMFHARRHLRRALPGDFADWA